MASHEHDLVDSVQWGISVHGLNLTFELLPLSKIGRSTLSRWVSSVDQTEVVGGLD